MDIDVLINHIKSFLPFPKVIVVLLCMGMEVMVVKNTQIRGSIYEFIK